MGVLIYIAIFALSLCSFYLAEYFEKKGYYNVIGYGFVIIGIIIPCLLAAFRASCVGTDTVYYEEFYDYATKVHPFSLYCTTTDNEILFDGLIYFCANQLRSYHAFLFLCQFLIITPIYFFSIELRRRTDVNISTTAVMYIYFVLFYNMTLNNMRQSIAAAFLLAGIYYYKKPDKFKAIILMVLAVCFHNSAVVGIVLIVISGFPLRYKKANARKLSLIALIIFFIIAIALLPQLSEMAYNNQMIPYTIYHYAERYFVGEGRVNMTMGKIAMLICRSILLLYPLLCGKTGDFKEYKSSEIQVILGTTIFVSFFTIYQNILAYRVTIYQDFFFMSFLPQFLYSEDYARSDVRKLFYIFFIFLYWGFYYIYEGWNGTYPYIFAFT